MEKQAGGHVSGNCNFETIQAGLLRQRRTHGSRFPNFII